MSKLKVLKKIMNIFCIVFIFNAFYRNLVSLYLVAFAVFIVNMLIKSKLDYIEDCKKSEDFDRGVGLDCVGYEATFSDVKVANDFKKYYFYIVDTYKDYFVTDIYVGDVDISNGFLVRNGLVLLKRHDFLARRKAERDLLINLLGVQSYGIEDVDLTDCFGDIKLTKLGIEYVNKMGLSDIVSKLNTILVIGYNEKRDALVVPLYNKDTKSLTYIPKKYFHEVRIEELDYEVGF